MAVVHDLGELWAVLIDVLRDDRDLTQMLATPTSIYRSFSETQLAMPSMVVECRALNPVPEYTGVAVYNPDVQINVFALDQDFGWRVYAHLEQNWQIPTQRPLAIESEHFAIRTLRLLNPVQIGPIRLEGVGSQVWHTAIEARLRVVRKKAA